MLADTKTLYTFHYTTASQSKDMMGSGRVVLRHSDINQSKNWIWLHVPVSVYYNWSMVTFIHHAL